MKKFRHLRERMLFSILAVAMLPVLIFALASQQSIQKWQQENLSERMEANLDSASRCLDLLLDKYATILFDLCTDDSVIETVEEINQNKDVLDVNTSKIRHEFSHICNRNQGVEGITMFLKNGQVVFYDKQNSSSVSSSWAERVECPEVQGGEVYRGVLQPVEVANKNTYLFQIARNLVDYRDIQENLGTVVISIDEKLVSNVIQVGANAETYLLDGDTVISAPAFSKVGKSFEKLRDTRANYYGSVLNETSGFTICVERDLSAYNNTKQLQIILLCVVSLVSVIIMACLSYILTRPYLGMVETFEDSIKRVENGDFSVRVKLPRNMPEEIENIQSGFNEMVEHLDDLINQVKKSSLEQRNAELSALEAQIDPHFLYNTLDTINWKAIEQGQYDISEMLVALANIFRYTVNNAGGTITLEQEFGWLTEYLLLQGARLGKMPTIEADIPEELMGFKIHKLLLQPFVENAVKYGFAGKEGQCVLRISVNSLGSQMHLMIEDNGNGIKESTLQMLNDETAEMEGHLGVANVRKRLKLYYGEETTVYFESQEGNYTRVHLFIPIAEMAPKK